MTLHKTSPLVGIPEVLNALLLLLLLLKAILYFYYPPKQLLAHNEPFFLPQSSLIFQILQPTGLRTNYNNHRGDAKVFPFDSR